jgi:hypothetical protein
MTAFPFGTEIMIALIAMALLCTAAALGAVLVSWAMRRSRLLRSRTMHRHSIAMSRQVYLLASLLCSVGALLAFPVSWSIFLVLAGSAGSFLLAEHLLLPRLADRERTDLAGARSRFEMIQVVLLTVAFINQAVPPLVRLAQVYGI